MGETGLGMPFLAILNLHKSARYKSCSDVNFQHFGGNIMWIGPIHFDQMAAKVFQFFPIISINYNWISTKFTGSMWHVVFYKCCKKLSTNPNSDEVIWKKPFSLDLFLDIENGKSYS